MKSDNVNLRKIDRMAVLAFKNSLRLHEDAIILFNKHRFPSAYTLSVLSLEELGKYFSSEDFIFHSRVDGRYSPQDEEKFINLIYQHRYKQNKFAYQIDYPGFLYFPGFAKRLIKEIYAGEIEKSKQDSIYVGLYRKNNIKGKISTPLSRITEQKAEKQITNLNDFILCFVLGFLKGLYNVDIPDLEKILTNNLILRLEEQWPLQSASAAKIYKKIKDYPDAKED
jgi:AbiV family abortive infection protein